MRFREASRFVAYNQRWKVVLAAIILPLPLLIAFFRSASFEGWSVSKVLSFTGLAAIWISLVLSLISPNRNWRLFKAVLLAISCLLLVCVALGLYKLGTEGAPTPVVLLSLGCVAALVAIAAVRVGPPSAEDMRIQRIADDWSGQPLAWWIKLLAFIMWSVLASLVLIPLYEMLS